MASHLFTGRRKLVRVRGQGFEVIRDGLEMDDLSQHRNLLILKEQFMGGRIIYHFRVHTTV